MTANSVIAFRISFGYRVVAIFSVPASRWRNRPLHKNSTVLGSSIVCYVRRRSAAWGDSVSILVASRKYLALVFAVACLALPLIARADCTASVSTTLDIANNAYQSTRVQYNATGENSCHVDLWESDDNGPWNWISGGYGYGGSKVLDQTYTYGMACYPEGTHTIRVYADCGGYNLCPLNSSPISETSFTVTHGVSFGATMGPTVDVYGSPTSYLHMKFSWQDDFYSSIALRKGSLMTKTQPTAWSDGGKGLVGPDGTATTVPIGLDGLYIIEARSCDKYAYAVVGADNKCACPNCGDCVGGPVSLTTGNMTYSDTVPLPSSTAPLSLTYDSSSRDNGYFGPNWTTFLDEWLKTETESDNSTTITLVTGDNRPFVFNGSSNFAQLWPLGVASGHVRSDGAGGYVYRPYGSMIEHDFDASGRLVKLHQISTGRDTIIQRDANGIPTRVEDSWGNWAWIVATDPTSHLITGISVEGSPVSWTFEYAGGSLAAVKESGSTWRTYAYSGGLTEIRDGKGNLIEGHAYGPNGATTSTGQTDDITSIQYGIATSDPDESITRVTYGSGAVADYYQHRAAGRLRTSHIEGSCSSCPNRNGVFAYDDQGRLIRQQDARGYITERHYDNVGRLTIETTALVPSGCDPETDPARCRQVGTLDAAQVSPTSATITRSVTYATAWPDKPETISTTSVLNSTGSRVESFTYDATSGEQLSHTTSGWTGSAIQPIQEDHTTTTLLYNGSEGAAFNPGGSFSAAWLALPQPSGTRKGIDGPRTDVSDVTTFVYYPVDSSVLATLRGRLAAVQNAAGHIMRYENYDVFGNAQRVVDPNGVATDSSFDHLGRSLTTTLKAVSGCDATADPLCATDLVSTRSYSPATGPLSTQTDARGNVSVYEYDALGRISATSRGSATTALKERIEYSYDPATGKKSSEKYFAMQNGSWVEKRRESYAYDSLAQLMTQTHPDSTSIGYTYDAVGTVASVRDENHATANTSYTYDPAHRLSSVKQTLAIAASGSVTTSYRYDIGGNLTGVTDPNGNVTSYQYDDFGRMLTQTSPVTGTTSYAYDLAGNLTSTTDANNAATTRTYDVLGRVASSTSVRGGSSEAVTWAYDVQPFGIGRLSTMTDPTGSTTYSYERRGMLAKETKVVNGNSFVSSYQYDAAGNRSTIGYPSGRAASYSFDFANRPSTLSVGSTPIVTSAAYLPFGPATSLVFGNGTTKTMNFDSRYRVQENKLTGPSGVLVDYSYGEDNVGNITSIHDSIDARYNRDFGYDDLNRLIIANGGSALWGAGSYSYDSMGNMLTEQVGRSAAFSYSGTTPKLLSVTENGIPRSVSYDSVGNETAGGEVYSPRNQLTGSSEGAAYAYDGRGVRVATSTPVSIRVVSLSVTPATVISGSTATGTITLNEPAPAGTVVTLSSSSPSAVVPATVSFTAGSLSSTFTMSTPSNASATTATITASLDVSSSSAVVTIHPVTVTAMALNPTSVVGGATTSGTITISDPIATTVTLSSSNTAAVVPSTINIPGGSQTGTFTVTTSGVTTTTSATITASATGPAQTASLTINPASLLSVTSVSRIVGPQSGIGTVSLDGAAAAPGQVVSLSSNNAAASVPSSVTIPTGASSATFTITTSAVQFVTSVTITATRSGVTRQTTFNVTPPPVVGLTVNPATAVGGDATVNVQATIASATSTQPEVDVYGVPDDLVSVKATLVPPNGTTAQTTLTTAPVATTTAVTIVGHVAQDSTSATATLTLQPPTVTLATLSINPVSVIGSNASTGTVTLTAPANKDIDVDVGSSYNGTNGNNKWNTPAYVRVPQGSQQATFPITTVTDTKTDTVTITARHGVTTRTANLSVAVPTGVYISGLSVSPSPIVGGARGGATGTVTLSAAPSANTSVTLSSSDTSVGVPSTVTVSKNKTSATFSITTSSVTTGKSATITATCGGVSQRFTLVVTPSSNAVTLASLSAASSINGPGQLVATVTLTGPAAAGGASVTISGGRANLAAPPATVTVPAGSTSTTFATAVYWTPYDKNVDLTATYNGAAKTVQVLIKHQLQSPLLRKEAGTEEDGGEVTSEPSEVVPQHQTSILPVAQARCASMSIEPCLRGVMVSAVPALNATVPGARYSIYTPEMNLMAETYATSTAFAEEYVWFAGQPVSQIDSATNTVHYYFNDHLGAPILTTDSTGVVDWRVEREPFGKIFATRVGTNRRQPLSLPGQEDDGTSERSYNVFRFYRSAWGRYTQADPIGLQGGLNLLSYAGANPLLQTDPLGLAYRWCRLYPPKSREYPRLPAGDVPLASTIIELPDLDSVSGEIAQIAVITKRRCLWRCYCLDEGATCYRLPCKQAKKGVCQRDHGIEVPREYYNKYGVQPCETYTASITATGRCGDE